MFLSKSVKTEYNTFQHVGKYLQLYRSQYTAFIRAVEIPGRTYIIHIYIYYKIWYLFNMLTCILPVKAQHRMIKISDKKKNRDKPRIILYRYLRVLLTPILLLSILDICDTRYLISLTHEHISVKFTFPSQRCLTDDRSTI